MNSIQHNTQEFMVLKNGQQFGPYPKQTLLENVRSGNFHLDDKVWHPAMTNWEAFRYHITNEEMGIINPNPQYPPQITYDNNNNYSPQPTYYPPPAQNPGEHRHAGGLAQTFGLDYRVALLIVVIDNMLFAKELITFGTLFFISFIVGGVLGFATYKAQKEWYGDDHNSALIKGIMMGLLTAIPTSIPMFLYVPSGVLGVVKAIRGK